MPDLLLIRYLIEKDITGEVETPSKILFILRTIPYWRTPLALTPSRGFLHPASVQALLANVSCAGTSHTPTRRCRRTAACVCARSTYHDEEILSLVGTPPSISPLIEVL